MEIKSVDVKKKIAKLLDDKITREEVDRWAYSIIKEEGSGNIVFLPPEDKDNIWSGVMYLYGIDIQEEPGEYLHTKDDIREMKEKIERKS